MHPDLTAFLILELIIVASNLGFAPTNKMKSDSSTLLIVVLNLKLKVFDVSNKISFCLKSTNSELKTFLNNFLKA